MEDWPLVRHLVADAVPKSRIAAQLGISRTRVYSAAESIEPPRHERSPVVSRILCRLGTQSIGSNRSAFRALDANDAHGNIRAGTSRHSRCNILGEAAWPGSRSGSSPLSRHYPCVAQDLVDNRHPHDLVEVDVSSARRQRDSGSGSHSARIAGEKRPNEEIGFTTRGRKGSAAW